MRRLVWAWLLCGLGLAALAGCASRQNAQGSASNGTTSALTAAGVTDSSDGLRFGAGWYPEEHFGGQIFRWVNNRAEIVACPDSSHRTIRADIEPGPSLGSKKLLLKVTGARPAPQMFEVAGRQTIEIGLANNKPQTVTLSTISQNRRIPKDNRFLNFRVFHMTLGSSTSNCTQDIVQPGTPLQISTGWYPLEHADGASFRWVNNDVGLNVNRPLVGASVIEFTIEPGPGMERQPLRLSLYSAGTKLATAKPVTGRSTVQFKLPSGLAAHQNLELRVEHSPKGHAPNDPRILNFRVFNLEARAAS